jgi:nicotinamide N-methyltransferase
MEGDVIERVTSMGYIWGHPVAPLLKPLQQSNVAQGDAGFDLIILSDLIFNHSQHNALLDTCEKSLKRNDPLAAVLVFYTHHRPHLAHRDLKFFELAKERGWQCDEVIRERFEVSGTEDLSDNKILMNVLKANVPK